MEALLQKWTKESSFDSSQDALLIETVDSIVIALGGNAKKYAEAFIKGAFDIVNSYIEKRNEESQKNKLITEREIAIRCIELLNTFVVEVLKNDALQFIDPGNYFNIFQECANVSFSFLENYLSQIGSRCSYASSSVWF